MTEKPIEACPRISIGGIKFSEELVQVSVMPEDALDSAFPGLLQLIAKNRINIPFISYSTGHDCNGVTFCIENDAFDQVLSMLNESSLHYPQVGITRSVGTLTLFPHKNNFHLLGQIISLFGKHHFPLYSLCTSISAIAVNTDYIQLDHIAEQLQTCLELPENHAPFRQEFCLKQLS